MEAVPNGRIPNLYWKGMSMDYLRTCPRFEPLPPVQDVRLSDLASYRHVRQDTPLNKALHAGMLTSGYINAALGFYEPAAARRLGVPSNRVNHSSLLNAVLHLCQPVYQPPPSPPENPPLHAPSQLQQPGASPSVLQGGGRAPLTATQSPTLLMGSTCSAAAGKLAGQGHHAHSRALATAAIKAQRGTSVAGSQHNPLDRATGRYPTTTSASDCSEKVVDSAAIAAGGIDRVRMAWGKTSEASALYDILQTFPDCQLAEVGLCCLEPAELESRWGFSAGTLPLLGASPDALLIHPPPPEAPAPSTPPSTMLGLVNRMDALKLDSKQEADSGLATNRAKGFPPGGEGVERSGVAGQMPAGQGMSVGGRAADVVHASGGRLEVVEVKNVCPFVERSSVNRKGKLVRSYSISDRSPADRVAPFWVPQLQLEMAATGADSALLISRSLTKGLAVFRLQRDDAYLGDLLHVVSMLHARFVQTRATPPNNVFMGLPIYDRLLMRTVTLAREAARVEVPAIVGTPPGVDLRPFLQA